MQHVQGPVAPTSTVPGHIETDAQQAGKYEDVICICRKCLAKGIEVKDLRDVAQLRVVVHPHTGAGSAPWPGTDDKQLCYHVMGLVSS